MLPLFRDLPWLQPHLCGTGQSIHVLRPSSVATCAKCSHKGLVPSNAHRAVHLGSPGPKVPRDLFSHPTRMWPKQGLQAQVGLTSAASMPPAGLCPLSPRKAHCRVAGWRGGPQASEAQLPEDLSLPILPCCCLSLLAVRLLWDGRKPKSFTLGVPAAAAASATLSS